MYVRLHVALDDATSYYAGTRLQLHAVVYALCLD